MLCDKNPQSGVKAEWGWTIGSAACALHNQGKAWVGVGEGVGGIPTMSATNCAMSVGTAIDGRHPPLDSDCPTPQSAPALPIPNVGSRVEIEVGRFEDHLVLGAHRCAAPGCPGLKD